MTGPATDDPARLLAEMHAVRSLVRDIEGARPDTAGHPALWAHARRAPGSPVDLGLERAIRSDPVVAGRYRRMLASIAVAHAPLAAAAADGVIRRRRVGDCELEVIPADAGSPPLLVVRSGERLPPPRIIEASLGPDAVRLALSEPVAGASVVSLDPASPEAEMLFWLLQDPGSEIFLL